MTKERSSSRQLFLQCQRKFKYQYVDNKVPAKKSRALEFGTLAHACREHFYKTGGDTEIEPMVDEWYADQLEIVERQKMLDFGGDGIIEQLNGERDLVLGMMRPYFAERKKDFDEYNILGVEKVFNLDLGGHQFCGAMDLVFEKKSNGAIYVDDFKTTGIDIQRYLSTRLDDVNQPCAYLWACKQIYGRADGMVFDVISKSLPKEPKTIKCKGKCKGNGTLELHEDQDDPDFVTRIIPCETCNGTGVIGLSKVNKDTTKAQLDTFFDEHSHVKKADYRDLYSSVGHKKYRVREIIPINQSQIDEWVHETKIIFDQIDAMKADPNAVWLRNFSACYSYNRRCSYADNCLFQSNDWFGFDDRVDPYEAI